MEKKDSELQKQLEEEFLAALEDYSPSDLLLLIPECVEIVYLVVDQRRTKLVSLAAQKFISEIASDAYMQSSLRQQNPALRRKDKKMVLTMEDLTSTVASYGIHINKPAYQAAKPGVLKEKKGTGGTSGGGAGRGRPPK